MKLYYLPGACSMVAHIALEWIGKPYQAEEVARDALRSPEYLALNPQGLVPTLTEGDWAISQNIALLEYLAAQHPEAKLLGEPTPRNQAEARRWLGILNADLHKTFSIVFRPQRYFDEEAQQTQLRDKAAAIVRDLFGLADKRLNGRDWLADGRSVSDAYLFVVMRWARAKNVDLSGYANLQAFFKRFEADPAVQKVFKAEGLA